MIGRSLHRLARPQRGNIRAHRPFQIGDETISHIDDPTIAADIDVDIAIKDLDAIEPLA
jgi:hypothetical protein